MSFPLLRMGLPLLMCGWFTLRLLASPVLLSSLNVSPKDSTPFVNSLLYLLPLDTIIHSLLMRICVTRLATYNGLSSYSYRHRFPFR